MAAKRPGGRDRLRAWSPEALAEADGSNRIDGREEWAGEVGYGRGGSPEALAQADGPNRRDGREAAGG
jgi:hypothetical protein